MKRLTTEHFIERARATHGDRYDYSNVEFNGIKKKVNIGCKEHGEFYQLGQNHLKGSGCPKCNLGRSKLTTNEFVTRAIEKHGNKYDYSKTEVDGTDNKIEIVCSIHGRFEQWPMDHLWGAGCPGCAGNARLTKSSFVKRAEEKHGDKYDYSKVNIINTHTKVEIVCPIHGVFKQSPNDHLTGYGCTICGGGVPVTKELFVERARNMHGDFYMYKEVSMTGMNNRVTIECPIHGEFEQRAADHVNGAGCPICATGKQGGYCEQYFETYPEMRLVPAKVYLVSIDNVLCKVGITRKYYVKDRFPGLRFNIMAVKDLPLYEAYQCEQSILDKFRLQRFKVKDFKELKQTGWTECFPITLLPEIIQEFD